MDFTAIFYHVEQFILGKRLIAAENNNKKLRLRAGRSLNSASSSVYRNLSEILWCVRSATKW